MAFGLPSTFSQYIPLNNLSKLQLIYIAIEVFKKLKWDLTQINENGLKAQSKNDLNTWNETIAITLEDHDPLITSFSNGNQIYDRGRNQKNIDTFLDLFYEIKKEESILALDESSVRDSINSETTKQDSEIEKARSITQFYSFFSIFIPTKDYFITPILININILIFLLMSFSGVNIFVPKTQDIIDWGGNFGPLTIENNWWRLISACFVHIGIFHLLMNCYALAYVGLLLESYLKKRDFLLTYLFCGLIASLASLYYNTDIVSAGASGAIFGMYGILLVSILFNTIDKKANSSLLLTIGTLIVLNIANSFKEGIDGAAHIGGLVSGIAFGSILALLVKNRKIGITIVASTTLILTVGLFTLSKNSKVYIYQIIEYQEGMQDFVDMEKMALESYTTFYGDSKENKLSEIKDRGIYYWNENIILLKQLDKLYLPEAIHLQNETLIEYCELRMEFYGLAYKKLNENTDKYDANMTELNNEINTIIIKIKSITKK
nr:rhomboid family intramembrane serine protease [uncultured Flavobacterium sp.]